MIHAKYTMVLKTILDDPNAKSLIDKALSTYPMYIPSNPFTYSVIPTRDELNNKILNHYKYREIGFETIGRFIDELEITMNEIMPYYYSLYKSADVLNGIDDPFGNVDIVETFEEETSGTSKGTTTDNSKGKTNSTANTSSTTNSEVDSKNRSIKSDTPQTTISNIDLEVGTSNLHASEVNFNNDNSNSKATNEGNDTTNSESEQENTGTSNEERTGLTKHTMTKVGNQGVNTYAHDLKELRETFLNIERQIINDERLSELFMLVY